MTRITALLLALLALAAQPRAGDPILVLVSFDGWRWDYTERLAAPNLRALGERGVRVRELIPSFPVQTFPNHYTVVTGLYPEHHGVVGNAMRDPAIPDLFTMAAATAREPEWWGGEPIWVTASRQGLRTASMFWPGSEAQIQGIRPTLWKPFDAELSAAGRTAQVLEWLALPDDRRPAFLALYLDDVDRAGHDYGPDSPQLKQAAATVDAQLGTLLEGVARLGLETRTTVVVISDHGMAATSDEHTIWLDDYIDVSTVEVVEAGGVLALAPRENTAASVDALYRRLRSAHRRLRVYKREETPARLHYRGNPRIAPIVGIPDDGWVVDSRARAARRLREGRPKQHGTHGYDPAVRAMHAIFAAAGPEVSRGLVVPSIDNVHLYDFLCAVLRVAPAPNDGDPGRVSAWIRRSP